MKIRHLLTDKNPDDRSATCSVCGPVTLLPNGPGKWICANKKRASDAGWRSANPEKVAASRTKVSEHKLSSSDPETRTGTCPICGPVEIVGVGRGFMCGVRSAELGRSPKSDPAAKCIVCNWFSTRANPVRGGRCLYHFVGWEYASLPHTEGGSTDADLKFLHAVGSDWSENESGGSGYTWVNLGSYEDDARRLPRNRKPRVLGDRNVPDEWKWALDPRHDWSDFDEEASEMRGEPQVALWADTTGNPWDAAEELSVMTTLRDHYDRLAEEGESFEDFEQRFKEGVATVGADPKSLLVRKLLDYEDQDY